jgi:FkbM family methyltransferase
MSVQFLSPGIKGGLQSLLAKAGIYERVKSSWMYDFYWSLFDRSILADRESEVNFYRQLLDGFRESDLVFDVGANQGYKADIFLRLGARVVAVEPDDASQEVLRRRFLKYRMKSKKLAIVSKAISDKNSTETMWIETPGSAKNTLSRKWAETLEANGQRFGQRLNFGQTKEVQTVSIEQLISEFGMPFFVKIDVEGHELNVLRGMKRPVPYLSFEVNLPEFRSEGLQCIDALAKLSPSGTFNYTADCRRGLSLSRWLSKDDIAKELESLKDASIEVFWTSQCAGDKLL